VTEQQSAPTLPVIAGPSGRTAALVLVAVALVAMLAVPVRSWFVQQARISDAEAQLAATEEVLDELSAQKERWQDKQVVEREARTRLNYVFPGKVGVVLVAPQAAPTAGDEPPETWFDSLWQPVDSASGRAETALGDPIQVRPTAPR
jgi:type II secretory pathway pseudopilin PulG